MEESTLTINEAKLKKIADEILRQRCTSGDEHQYHIDQMNNFLKIDISTELELGHEHKFITEIVVRRANECIVSITESDYKNLNKNDIEDIYLLIMNSKDFQLGIESYQQKVNLTAPTISFLRIEKHKMFFIIYEPMHGIIYKNSKKEKRVMRHSEIHKFYDAILEVTMSSATSDVTYTSVYTDSEPGRAFWGADYEGLSEGGIPRVIVLGYDGLPLQPVAPPSPDFMLGPENPQTPPVPQEEDEREPLFIQAHDPNYVPEPIYPEYIPLEDDHEFPAEEQPLPPIDSPTAESPGYITESDPEEDPEGYEDDETEDGPVDYPMDTFEGVTDWHQSLVTMSSATSDVTYTSVYTDSEPGRAFWGADYEEISEGGIPRVIVLGYDGLPLQPVAPPSPDFILGPENPQTPPVPQDEDEREPMFIQAHDPDYVPEPIYPEYIPLEDDHEFPAEEQPLPPMDGGDDGDDDDGDSSRDDANDEDEDEEDEEDEEEEEHLAPADSTTVIPADEPVFPPEGTEPIIPPPSTDITIGARITIRPQTSISLPPEAEVERLLTMTTPSPSPPISLSPPSAGERLARCTAPPAHSPPLPPSSGCLTQIQTLRIASTQALIDAVTTALPPPSLPPLPPSLSIPSPVDRRDDIPESEQPPRKRLHLSTLGSRYEIGESSTARPARDVGYGIRDTWVDPAEAVPEIAPMTVGEVNTRVTELAELHEHDTQDLYAY
ncbi:hypothetical protein Tco_0322541 [Tanacetum coccineum]